jgi:hypothetical protein
MSTKSDSKRLKSFYYYSAFFTFSSLGNGFLWVKILTFLRENKPLSFNLKNGIPAGFTLFAMIYSYYKLSKFKSSMDKKYTPLWMKSSGNTLIK